MSKLKGWKFPIQIDEKNGKIATIEDNENVKQSINIILGTHRYERKIFQSFGTDLRAFMFEIVDPGIVSTLKKTINSSLKTWEKHIEDIDVSVQASTGPVSTLEAVIEYVTDIEPTAERIGTKIDTIDR